MSYPARGAQHGGLGANEIRQLPRQAAVQAFIAGEKTLVEQADRELGVALMQLAALLDRADGVAEPQSSVPEGAQELGVPLEDHIEFCVKAMQTRADELGLKGTIEASGS